jgi:hypothetical protein
MPNTLKRDRFLRLAPYRTNQVLKKLKTLGNCANRSAYEYNEEEINKIFSVIDREVKKIKTKFTFHNKNEFTL